MSYMVNCTKVIVGEIKRDLPQKTIIKSYALAMISAAAEVDKPDWSIINKAILDRWSMKGLRRIHDMAREEVRNWALTDKDLATRLDRAARLHRADPMCGWDVFALLMRCTS